MPTSGTIRDWMEAPCGELWNYTQGFTPLYSFTSDCSEDSYVPMNPNASPSVSESESSTDGYIPMSPVTAAFTFPASVNSKVTSPLPELPVDLEPPPVNRDLKPRRKMRPPPLDLRNLSTIREHTTCPVSFCTASSWHHHFAETLWVTLRTALCVTQKELLHCMYLERQNKVP
ncbi:unnamed protein product [Ranitomeya imitator]|uniref:Uncharacterized protein n=1 Tax=Ranitomeya imitator TaxID=111125 RepID=A0ABN9MMW3_9NEOB|nr:unnamed protein product [Ranitomeya imitator]